MTRHTGFAYTRDQFRQIVEDTLAMSRSAGASDAGVEVSEGVGLSVSARMGELENVERNRDKSLGVTVYVGQRRGNASTSDFSRAAIEQTVQAAYDIARFTAEDRRPACPTRPTWPAPLRPGATSTCSIPGPSMPRQRLRWRCAAKRRRSAPIGASPIPRCRRERPAVAFLHGQHARFSRRLCQFAPLAVGGADRVAPDRQARTDMQRDYWYSSMRDARDLAAPEAVVAMPRTGTVAPGFAQGRHLRVRCCSSLRWLPGCSAHSCRRRRAARSTASRASWKAAWPAAMAAHLDLHETAHRQSKGSAPFDDEGSHRVRDVVKAGIVQGYFLSCYSARKPA